MQKAVGRLGLIASHSCRGIPLRILNAGDIVLVDEAVVVFQVLKITNHVSILMDIPLLAAGSCFISTVVCLPNPNERERDPLSVVKV